VERENAALSKIWSIKQEWDREWDEWKEIAFQELKSDEEILAQMDERAVEIKMKLDNLEAAEKKWKVTEYINDKIRVFRDTIPLIEDLRHESMRDRHWKELRIEVKEDFDEEDSSFNVEKIFDL
jgi:dynein heavy chain